MRSRGEEAGWCGDEALVHDGQLQEVLGQGSRIEVVVVSLAYTSQEAHWAGPAKLKAQHAEHESLRLEDLLGRISAIDHVHNLVKRWTVNLFILGGHEDSGGTDELKLADRHDLG